MCDLIYRSQTRLYVCLFSARLAKVYTASSQIIKRIILRHLEHPVSILQIKVKKQAWDFSFKVKMGQQLALATSLFKPKSDNVFHYYGEC